MRPMFLVLLALCFAVGCGYPASSHLSSVSKYQKPDPDYTPGSLCTAKDEYFDEYRYDEHIAHCARHVTKDMKLEIADHYGIDEADFSDYEFDHWYPLAIGGSTDIENIFPQPIDEAKVKDKLEEDLYKEMSSGDITQKEAVDRIDQWAESK